MKITVLGAGAWGTALAIHFAQYHQVILWGKDKDHIQALKKERQNTRYLSHHTFPTELHITDDFSLALKNSELILCATPVSGLRSTLQNIKKEGQEKTPFLWACKGFEQQTGLLPHQILLEEIPNHHYYGALSGPSFADELARGLPCAVCIASPNGPWLRDLVRTLNTSVMRLYANTDLIGAEVGGALKNIMAIATGVSDGLNCGLNARAALITRGLAEMSRLSTALGARTESMMGLAGMGDLVLTCTGNLSRNRTVGLLLAQNKDLPSILKELGHVAEGVFTAFEALKMANRHRIDLPITEIVCALLNGHIQAKDAVENLMNREPRSEI